MAWWTPEHSGHIDLNTIPPDFSKRMAKRVEEGLLVRGNRTRANYRVTEEQADLVAFEATDGPTAYNIGLNQVRLRVERPNRVTYEFSYWRWLRFSVTLCGAIGGLLVLSYLVFTTMSDQAPAAWYGPVIFWGMAIFWGVCWPWILAALHKAPAARCFECIIREECGEVMPLQSVQGRARHYQSEAAFFGMPLLSIAIGPAPGGTGTRGHAHGIVAIGDTATGVVAVGGAACGLVAFGGVAVGGLCIGGAAIGIAAVGGMGVGVFAMGGLAIGVFAVGGGAFGLHALGGNTGPF